MPSEAHDGDQPGRTPRQEYKRKHAELQRRAKGVKKMELAPCGTEAAYRRHHRNGETIDDACYEAHRETARAARQRRAAAKTEPPDAPAKPGRAKRRRKLRRKAA